MELESERLRLRPLRDEEMREMIRNEQEPDLRQAYSEMLQGCLLEPENRLWHVIWGIERKDEPGTFIGELSFKGRNPDGMAEIGYSLRTGFCGKGYMTEALRRITEWALAQAGVARVEAETAPDNLASQRVLAACGFIPTGTRGEEGPRFVYRQAEQKGAAAQ